MRNSLGSRCRPGSPKGRTETHEVAKGAEAERRRALFAGEAESYKLLQVKLSSLWERDLCEGGDSMADSGDYFFYFYFYFFIFFVLIFMLLI